MGIQKVTNTCEVRAKLNGGSVTTDLGVWFGGKALYLKLSECFLQWDNLTEAKLRKYELLFEYIKDKL